MIWVSAATLGNKRQVAPTPRSTRMGAEAPPLAIARMRARAEAAQRRSNDRRPPAARLPHDVAATQPARSDAEE